MKQGVHVLLSLVMILVSATRLHAEPLSQEEVREAHRTPIPCHEIEAAAWMYSVRETFFEIDPLYNLLTSVGHSIVSDITQGIPLAIGVGDQIVGMRVTETLPHKMKDLINQDYARGMTVPTEGKAYLIPFVDIDDAGNHTNTIRYWIVYRPAKYFQPVYSKSLSEFGDYHVWHPLYQDVYSRLRPERGWKASKSQKPYLAQRWEKRRAVLDSVDGVDNWETVRMESVPITHKNEYAVAEICYPTMVVAAELYTSESNCTEEVGGPMPLSLASYLEGNEETRARPDCLGHSLIRRQQLREIDERLEFAEGVLWAIGESTPIFGTLCTAARCESMEDYRCWSDVGVGLLGDAGSMLVPVTKLGRLGVALRATGKVMVGAAAAGNVALAIQHVREGENLAALARVLNAGFNVLELRIGPKKAYGGRKIEGPDAPIGSGCGGSGCPGTDTLVIKSSPATSCDLLSGKCGAGCGTQLKREWSSAEQAAEYLAHRNALLERAGDAANNPEYDALARTLEMRQADGTIGKVGVVDIGDEVTVDAQRVSDWNQLITGMNDEEAMQFVELSIRNGYLKKLDPGKGFYYWPNPPTVRIGRIKIATASGKRPVGVSNRAERILKDLENKLNLEEVAHSIAMRNGKGTEIRAALGRMPRGMYPFFEKVLGFKCWLESNSSEELFEIAEKLGIGKGLNAAERADFQGLLLQQLEEVDALIFLREQGYTLTDAWLSPYQARRMYLHWEQIAAKAAQ